MRRLFVAFVSACVPVLLAAQIPSRSVNMVSGTTWPGGDPFLQRQNEPAIAASTRNPLHLLAGANDYRTVDLPGLPNSNETGDAWMGLFKSTNGGATWTSTLVPGYPQDTSPEGLASPLKAYTAAADPVVRAGTHGLFFYSGIVFNRTTPTASGLFVARFIDNNNKEAGDPVVYLDTKLVATNPGTEFIDKPWFAVDIPRSGAPTCSFTTTQPNPTAANPTGTVTVEQSFPGGAAYIVYSLISGEGTATRSQVYFSRSLDCGATWSAGLRISSLDDPVNQGATLAIDPRNGTIYIAWRRFSADGTDDTIMVTRSMDQGMKWDPPGRARRFPRGRKVGLQMEIHGQKFKYPVELADLASLDQPTLEDRFRTNAYPTMAIDDQGRAYVAWSERGFAALNADPDDGDARVLIATSTNLQTWTDPQPIDNGMIAGHQVMPSMSFAGGKLMIAYYDFRQDVSGVFRKWIDETSAVTYGGKRHTVDVRAAMADPGANPSFGASVQVSEYLWGSRPGTGPRLVEQLQFNPPNLKLFRLGTVPFFGDYIDLAPSPAFVPIPGGWAYNTAPASSPLFHVVWTDNRDVVPPPDGDWTNYTPPGATANQTSLADPSQTLNACVPGHEGMRNQNIYTARITGGLVAGSPGNSKQLDPLLQRTFVVFAQNATYVTKTFRLTIENQPPGGRASFSQYPLPPFTAESAPPLTVLEVVVPSRSTIARTVYATSSEPHAQINVSVVEITGVNGTEVQNGLESTIVLNPDPENPDISNPDISNPDISNPDISNAEVHNPDISNPDISNPDISNPDISNPDISNPDISNPDISNVQVANPDISNPDISNPDISNPDISNPDISNPDISNPDISNQSLTDTTWTITNDGNTTTAYSLKLLLSDPSTVIDPSIILQLILRRVYTTPVAVNCELALHAHNVLLANILNPVFTTADNVSNPDISNPDISNATLWLAPGESAKITIRTLDKNIHDAITFDAATAIIPVVVSQPINTADLGTEGATPPIAFPSSPFLTFIEQPASGSTNSALGPVRVRVTDNTGAPLPGVGPVTLGVYLMPNAATPVRTLSSVTNVTGIATFDIGTFAAPGTYRMKASVLVGEDDVFTWSDSFVLTEPPPVTFSVTTTADSGTGTLRQAILDANANGPSRDTIAFNIPAGPLDVLFTISPLSPLPDVEQPIVIDGATQPEYAGVPNVYIDGSSAGAFVNGLRLWGANSDVRGIGVTSFQGSGIWLFGANGSRVRGSYIGIAPDGGAAGNNTGVRVQASNTTIGGTTGEDRNVISGNSAMGIRVDSDAGNTIIVGNYIGTNAAGAAAVPNGAGIVIDDSSASIGGGFPAARNVISGNSGDGILLSNGVASVISGNYIGVDAAGTADLGNAQAGIRLNGNSSLNVIGVPGSPNVISGNNAHGVVISDSSSQNEVRGNLIGTNAAGTAAIGNGTLNEFLELVGAGVQVLGPNNTIGGITPGSANVLSGNGTGVSLSGTGAIGNKLWGNLIGTNAAGTGAIRNRFGIFNGGAPQTVIGGTTTAERNVVSGNLVEGIAVTGESAVGIRIEGNYIGTSADGMSSISNTLYGISVRFAAQVTIGGGAGVETRNLISGNGGGGIRLEANGNVVEFNSIGPNASFGGGLGNGSTGVSITGSSNRVDSNVIRFNGADGITATGAGNGFSGNSISDNGGLGIDQGGDGVTANDATETDGVQNFPILTLAEVIGGTTRLVGSLQSTPSTTFDLRFYTTPSCDPSGNGEGSATVAVTVLTTNSDGLLNFDIPAGIALAPGSVVTATARNMTTNDTSEFSPCVTVTAGGLDDVPEPTPAPADGPVAEPNPVAWFEHVPGRKAPAYT